MGDTIRLRIMVLLSAWLAPAAHAAAPRLKIFRCAQMLLSLRERHESEGRSRLETLRALDHLHQFRAHHLGAFDFTPGDVARTTTDRSGDARKNLLARRLSALIDEGLATSRREGRARGQQFTRASVFEGNEEVGRVLALMARARAVRPDLAGAVRQSDVTNFAVGPLRSVIASLPLVALGAAPSATTGVLGAAYALAMLRELEAMVRGLASYRFGRALEDQLHEILGELQEGGWWATAFDDTVPRGVIEALWARRALAPDDVAAYARGKRHPRWFGALNDAWSSRLFPSAVGRDDRERISRLHLRTDLVLTRLANGQPRLVIATRISDALAKYSAPASAPAPATPVLPAPISAGSAW